MTSTTSGTTTFSMDVDDIIEEALEPLGGEHTSATDMEKARRTLNLLLIQLQNKNIPLHKVGTEVVSLVQGVRDYTLPANIKDVLGVNYVKDDTETRLQRYSIQDYHKIPTKDQEGRPSVFSTDRLRDAVELKIWPTPKDEDSLSVLCFRKIEDVNAAYQKVDIPSRYYPLLIAMLSYSLSLHRQGIPSDIRAELKMNRDEILMDTFEEDKERVDITITPGGISGW